MNRTVTLKGVPILALSIVLAACGQVSADQPSADPVPSKPPAAQPSEEPSQEPAKPVATPRPSEKPAEQPAEQPSQEPSQEPAKPVATPKPSEKPAEQPAEQPSQEPSQEPAKPVATPKPTVVVRHDLPMVGRVTRDGVAVRNLPDLQSDLVDGNDRDDQIVQDIRLRIGDEVLVINGPILADGYSWYEVVAGAKGPAQYFRGFVAGEFLTRLAGAEGFVKVASVDGQGFSASASGHAHAYSPLIVNLAVTTMDGDASCSFELVIVGTEGQRIEIVPEMEIGEATIGQVAAPNLETLYMETAGNVTLDVTSDCSFAVMVNVPQG